MVLATKIAEATGWRLRHHDFMDCRNLPLPLGGRENGEILKIIPNFNYSSQEAYFESEREKIEKRIVENKYSVE